MSRRFHPVWTLLALSIFFLGIAIVFADQFEMIGLIILERFGLGGLFVTTFLLDYLIQPFPPDIPLYSFLLSGSPFYITVLGTGLASVLAAVCAYWTGRLLGYEGAVKYIGKGRYEQAHKLFMKRGMFGVVVAALTPVPFNAVCWTAGIFKMPFVKFLLSTIGARLPRYFLVGWLAFYVN